MCQAGDTPRVPAWLLAQIATPDAVICWCTEKRLASGAPWGYSIRMPDIFDPDPLFNKAIVDHLSVIRSLPARIPILSQIASQALAAVLAGHKILWCGNGGSAADAQHLAAEFVVRFHLNRRSIPSIALTTDSSVLTATSNDLGYEHVFQRQVEALACPGDMVIGISTSGNSANVCAALQAARSAGAMAVAFTGEGGGKLAGIADLLFAVPSRDVPRIQEAHILAGHMICQWVESEVVRRQSR